MQNLPHIEAHEHDISDDVDSYVITMICTESNNHGCCPVETHAIWEIRQEGESLHQFMATAAQDLCNIIAARGRNDYITHIKFMKA